MEKFFLPSKDEGKKQELFEKESLDNDFLLVKPCDKKPGKVVHKAKHVPKAKKAYIVCSANTGDEEKPVLLSDMLGLK